MAVFPKAILHGLDKTYPLGKNPNLRRLECVWQPDLLWGEFIWVQFLTHPKPQPKSKIGCEPFKEYLLWNMVVKIFKV